MPEKSIRLSAMILALWFVAGCETVPVVEAVMEEGGLERWGCGDYFDGCGFRKCPVTLTADFHAGSGTVKFAGITHSTRFEVAGLTRRWDWCPQDDGRFGCAFVVDTDDGGSYYDFTSAMADPDGRTRTKPSELFKCTRRRVRDA